MYNVDHTQKVKSAPPPEPNPTPNPTPNPQRAQHNQIRAQHSIARNLFEEKSRNRSVLSSFSETVP